MATPARPARAVTERRRAGARHTRATNKRPRQLDPFEQALVELVQLLVLGSANRRTRLAGGTIEADRRKKEK